MRWLDIIEELPIVKASKKVVFPGFDRIPFYDVMVFFIRGIQKGSLNTRATSLSFQFFLSLFPTLILIFTLIPFIPINGFQEGLMELIQEVLPPSTYDLTASTLEDIVNRPRAGLLSFVFVAVLYLATNGIDAMLDAFGESVHIERKRNYFMQKGVAFMILLTLTIMLLVGISLLILGSFAVDYVDEHYSTMALYMFQFIKWAIVVALYYFSISFLYYYGNVKRQAWRFMSAGSTFSTICSILLSWGFAYYVNNFAMYNSLYGSIGTLIVILLWIYFNSFVILIGFELNASIQQAGFSRDILDQEL